MGLFDFLKGRRQPAPAAPLPPTPFPATIATLTADGVGTLTLADASTLRFGASACQGFLPAVGLAVRVTGTGPHPVGGFRATSLTLASDEATYRRLLQAQMAAMTPQAPPPSTVTAAAPPGPPPAPPAAAPPRLDLPELDAPPAPGKRRVAVVRLENSRPPDVYFCELTLDGRVVSVFGGQAPEASPQRPSRVISKYGDRYATAEEARRAFERLVAEAARNYKTRRQEVREVDEPPASGRCVPNPALEAAFEQSSDPAAAARVLADWLQGQNDPRGELAALLQQGQPDEARAFLARHARTLLGELDVALDSELTELTWRHGFLEGASLKRRDLEGRTVLAELTGAFLALPLARFVTALRFGLAGYESDNDWTDTLRAVVESPRGPLIRSLRFDDYGSEDCELSWTAFGDFSPFWSKLPALEWLHLRSGEGGVLGDIELPSLKTFIRESGGLGAEEIRSIVHAKWPRLERLDVWFGSAGYGAAGSVDLIRPLLDGDGLPALKHLGLVNAEFAPEALAAVLRSKVLPRLEVLDLSRGVLMDRDVEPLLADPGAVAHLKRLDLSSNLLDASVGRLTAALPNVEVGDQRYEEGDTHRFVAVGE